MKDQVGVSYWVFTKRCQNCFKEFKTRRSHAITCGVRCRKAYSRAIAECRKAK